MIIGRHRSLTPYLMSNSNIVVSTPNWKAIVLIKTSLLIFVSYITPSILKSTHRPDVPQHPLC
uniref:Putative ovule protein n=1 Tax=Solanum chacoense TaxID=4108 RepID=A0A0V0GV19_SOLCH